MPSAALGGGGTHGDSTRRTSDRGCLTGAAGGWVAHLKLALIARLVHLDDRSDQDEPGSRDLLAPTIPLARPPLKHGPLPPR